MSGNRSLSTGKDKASVENLNRPGELHEFEVPNSKLDEWEDTFQVEHKKDLDHETQVLNDEVRIYPPASSEMNKFKKTLTSDQNDK